MAAFDDALNHQNPQIPIPIPDPDIYIGTSASLVSAPIPH